MTFGWVRFVPAALAGWIAGAGTSAAEPPTCVPTTLPVLRVEAPPSQYADFCNREGAACDLTGASVIDWTPRLHDLLEGVNAEVNKAVTFVPDPENSGREEDWSYPVDGLGDCEDFALEKRRRLVAAGLPGAALTCAIAFHEVQLFAHAVLLVETTRGTFVLDNLSDTVPCWDAVPFRFTRRELPDGRWLRFVPP